MAGPRLIRAFADAYPSAFFVEVGSNDGEKYDHLSAIIHSGAWSGIMVEPVPYVFERLRRNYGNHERVILENVAIADRDSHLPFYYLAQVDEREQRAVPDWYDAIGSFVLETILGHRDKIPDIENRIVRAEVPCMTFQSLCAKHGVEHVDFILVDTEGYDWEIIKNVDFSLHRPRLLIYEHFHLPADERAQCRRYLEGLGYETMEEGFDTFCLDTRTDDRLTRAWRRLRPAIAGAYVETEAKPAV
jgi:FkbM family methyltransferase